VRKATPGEDPAADSTAVSGTSRPPRARPSTSANAGTPSTGASPAKPGTSGRAPRGGAAARPSAPVPDAGEPVAHDAPSDPDTDAVVTADPPPIAAAAARPTRKPSARSSAAAPSKTSPAVGSTPPPGEPRTTPKPRVRATTTPTGARKPAARTPKRSPDPGAPAAQADPLVRAEAPAPAKTASKTVEPRVVLEVHDVVKRFADIVAVDHVSLSVLAGSIFGIVGPNGAGKTTTLSMVTGLLRPDGGSITVHGADVWTDPVVAKRNMGVLPDRLRLFDRLTGSQLLYYAGTLRGLDAATVKKRSADLAAAFGLDDALDRLVADYSAGMTKKVALASAMIHSPRLLILDEPFESVDPVSAANITEILQNYAAAGGTVVLSSHSMDLVQRMCDFVAIVVSGSVLAAGTMGDVRGIGSLEERFVELAGGRKTAEGMEWLHSFSD
jgi:ABC-type multidrug transport system ATPase subunit